MTESIKAVEVNTSTGREASSRWARAWWIVGMAFLGVAVGGTALWLLQVFCLGVPMLLTGGVAQPLGLATHSGLCGVITGNPPWTLLGALVAAPSVLYSWWSRTTHKDQDVAHALRQLDHAAAQLEHEKLKSRDDLAAKQFNDAVELLCSNDSAKQSAGVYSLQRVARYSEREVEAVCEVLAAYIRLKAEIHEYCDLEGLSAEERQPGATVQSALLVLGAIKGTLPVSLRGLDLYDVRIEGNFSHVDFEGTVFEYSTLRGDFSGSRFVRTYFANANFLGKFHQANFEGSREGTVCDIDGAADFAGATGKLPARVTAETGIHGHAPKSSG